MSAARVLGGAKLGDDQLLTLVRAVGAAGALMLPRLLPAFKQSSNPQVGAEVVAAIGKAPGFRSLNPDDLKRTLRVYPEEVRQHAEPLLRQLQIPEAEKASRLRALEPILATGDPLRGREVFFGSRATCSTCHTIGSEGGHVGPDLSRIGAVRSGRDLLEAVLFPSASFARGYEPFTIATNDGHLHTGIIARETSDAIVLTTPDRKDISLARSTIDEIEPGKLSIMPRGLDANLNLQELADLFAFLRLRK